MTVFDLEHLELAYAPPYGSAKDPVNMVGFLGANLLRGDIDLWYPEDYPECADRVTILDTRTQAEYDAWHIPEAILIPYTELRERLDEVPRDKPVYTYCRSGFRSYIAYCVLKQNGFDDVAFLSGGMMTSTATTAPADGRQGRHAGGGARRGRAGPAAGRARPRLTRRPHERWRHDMADVPVDVALRMRAEHAEGPLWDAASARLWWVDITGEQVHCLDPATGQDTSWSTPGQPGGVALGARRTGGRHPQRAGGARHGDGGTTELLVPIEADSPRTVRTTSRSTATAVRGSARWPTTSGGTTPACTGSTAAEPSRVSSRA